MVDNLLRNHEDSLKYMPVGLRKKLVFPGSLFRLKDIR